VSREIFQQTMEHNISDVIYRAFCINWAEIQYSDLSIPLHSGIAISIHLHHLYDQMLQVTATDNDKARFWVESFGKEAGSELTWLSRIPKLRKAEGNLSTLASPQQRRIIMRARTLMLYMLVHD
jgi:hypothetical protein